MRGAVFALLLAGCSFEHGVTPGGGSADAGGDSKDVDASDGSCVPGFLNLCAEPAPTQPLHLTGPDTIDTDTDPRCRTLVQQSGNPVCLVYATSGVVSPPPE